MYFFFWKTFSIRNIIRGSIKLQKPSPHGLDFRRQHQCSLRSSAPQPTKKWKWTERTALHSSGQHEPNLNPPLSLHCPPTLTWFNLCLIGLKFIFWNIFLKDNEVIHFQDASPFQEYVICSNLFITEGEIRFPNSTQKAKRLENCSEQKQQVNMLLWFLIIDSTRNTSKSETISSIRWMSSMCQDLN